MVGFFVFGSCSSFSSLEAFVLFLLGLMRAYSCTELMGSQASHRLNIFHNWFSALRSDVRVKGMPGIPLMQLYKIHTTKIQNSLGEK